MSIKVDGQQIRDQLLQELRAEISARPVVPRLDIVYAGDNQAVALYVALKQKYGEKIGLLVKTHHFSESASTAEVLDLIEKLNQQEQNGIQNGIIVQLPLTSSLNE